MPNQYTIKGKNAAQRSVAEFNDILRLVQSGLGIRKVLNQKKIDSTAFYASISEEQKLLLRQTKVATTVGKSGYRLHDNRDMKEVFPIRHVCDPDEFPDGPIMFGDDEHL